MSVRGRAALYAPRRVAVAAGPDGAPLAVDGVAVEAVREEWLVEDRWWTPRPLRRHYFELALADGRAPPSSASAAAGAGTGSGPERGCRCRRPLRRAARPLRLLLPRRRLDPAGAGRRRGRARLPGLALTDHDGVWGSMEFAQACKGLGVRPITGAELTVALGDGRAPLPT